MKSVVSCSRRPVTLLQNRSFQVIDKNVRAKRAKLLFVHRQMCRFATLLSPSSLGLLELHTEGVNSHK